MDNIKPGYDWKNSEKALKNRINTEQKEQRRRSFFGFLF